MIKTCTVSVNTKDWKQQWCCWLPLYTSYYHVYLYLVMYDIAKVWSDWWKEQRYLDKYQSHNVHTTSREPYSKYKETTCLIMFWLTFQIIERCLRSITVYIGGLHCSLSFSNLVKSRRVLVGLVEIIIIFLQEHIVVITQFVPY